MFKQEQPSNNGEGLVEIKTIGVEKAIEMQENAIFAAKTRKISGYFVAVSRTEMIETSQAIGSTATPTNVDIAMAKIKTVRRNEEIFSSSERENAGKRTI